MPYQSDRLGLDKYSQGESAWSHNDLVDWVDEHGIQRASIADRPAPAVAGRLFLADDEGPTLYVTSSDATQWLTLIEGGHMSDTGAHHTRYADTEARNAVTGSVDAAALTSADATAAGQAALSDGAGGLSWTDIVQGLYDTGDTVVVSQYSGPGFKGTTTNTTFTDPSSWNERGMLDWAPLHALQTGGILQNFRIVWGAYRIHENTSGQTSTFRLGNYGTAGTPYSDGRTENSVTNTAGPAYRDTVQFAIDDLTNFTVWTPICELKTDGGEAQMDGGLLVQLKGDVA